ncbi:Uncharacterised protein [Mycobacterium tuberculosis]|nr:Uncharacterised protein [Mycobacterium tuberculosis]
MSNFFSPNIQQKVAIFFIPTSCPTLKHVLHGNRHFTILAANQFLKLFGKNGIRTFRLSFKLQFFYMKKHLNSSYAIDFQIYTVSIALKKAGRNMFLRN